MANLFDYLAWRGDLPFSQSPLCDIDALIFSRLAYIRFDGIVPQGGSNALLLSEAAQYLARLPDANERVRNPQDLRLLQYAAASPRFSAIRLSHYRSLLDVKQAEQFAAVCLEIQDGSHFLTFRGTDNTLAGWKEDFNMSFLSPVPGQLDALGYLTELAETAPGPISLGGHSKGGNLAVYAAAFAAPQIQARIRSVYNHDGPGFPADVLVSPGYIAVHEKIRTFIPQSSIVGLFLEHEDTYTIIRSNQTGILQHDVYSWQVLACHFICLDTVTNSSRFLDQTFRQWLSAMTPQQREILINTVFDALASTQAVTLPELAAGWSHNARRIMQSLHSLDPEQQRVFTENFQKFRRALRENLPILLNRKAEDDSPETNAEPPSGK